LLLFGRAALRSAGPRFERFVASGGGFFRHGTDPSGSCWWTRFAQQGAWL
jgi:hypothetical protein